MSVARPSPAVQTIIPPKGHRPRILVIDDDYMVRQYIKDVLGQDHDVLCLATGLNLQNILHQADPDMVILDIMLPWIDGYELCKVIRSHEPFSGLPILFLTGQKREDKDFFKALDVGGNGYMTKPFSPHELQRRVAEFLTGEVD